MPPLPYHGPIPPDIWLLLHHAHDTGGFALQSDVARGVSQLVALAASCGWLSVISPDGSSYEPKWRITAAGLTALQHKDHLNGNHPQARS